MKKRFVPYLILWAILFALFQVIAFVAPGWKGQEKYTAAFWIGYGLITVMFFGQLICSWFAFKADSLQKLFYRISLIRTSYVGLILSFVFGGLTMILNFLPGWVGAIVCAIVLVANALTVVKASAAVDAVEQIDEKIKAQTFFIRSATLDAESILTRAESPESKAACTQVYEAIRYSDPMSHEALASLEAQISLRLAALQTAVAEKNQAVVESTAKELVLLVGDRNRKCRLLK